MAKTYNPYKMHTIAIDDSNYHTLKELGSFGDTYNDVIAELINIAKKKVEDRQDDNR
jgi:predicted CopG family antitoxin